MCLACLHCAANVITSIIKAYIFSIITQLSWLKCHLTVIVSKALQTLPVGEALNVHLSPRVERPALKRPD